MARQPDMNKRREIASAAFEVMRKRGAHKTSMSEIAKALGMKRPTLYWYFGDLGEIFEAVFRQILDEQAIFMGEALAGVTHPIDILFESAVAVDAFYKGREDMIVFLFQLWAVGGGGETARALSISMEYFQPRRAMGVELVRAGIEMGLVEPCDPAQVVHFVAAFIDGLLVQRVSQPDTVPPLHDFLWERVLLPLKRSS